MEQTSFCPLRALVFTGVFFVLVLGAIPSSAAADDSGWMIRAGAVWADPDVDIEESTDDGSAVTGSADSEVGFGFGLEYRRSDRFGFDFALLYAAPEVEIRADEDTGESIRASDDLGMTVLTVGFNYHLTPDSAVDLYVGPFVAWVRYGDLDFYVSEFDEHLYFDSKDDFAWGATVGADIGFGDGPWSLSLNARYLDTQLQVTEREDGERSDLDVDSILVTAGVGFRF